MQNKKVYIVIRTIFNGCDEFQSIESVWGEEDDAELRCIELQDANKDPDESYWYRIEDVK